MALLWTKSGHISSTGKAQRDAFPLAENREMFSIGWPLFAFSRGLAIDCDYFSSSWLWLANDLQLAASAVFECLGFFVLAKASDQPPTGPSL